MTYLLKTKRQRGRDTRLFFIVCGLVILIFLAYKPLSRVLVFIGGPIWNASQALRATKETLWSTLSSKKDLLLAHQTLEQNVDQFTEIVAEVSMLREENAGLKDMLGRTPTKKRLLSAVLGNPAQTPYDTLLIDVGSTYGVTSGAKVSVRESVIGTVTEVTPKWSRVRLLSSPNEEHVVIIGKTKVTALATGRGSGNFDARLPRELDVSINDTVTFPELNKQVLAVVEAIEVTPNDSFQRILFKSPINIAEIRFVEVDMNIDR
ncbi:MAG: rod shape-determining protein MreC [Patescibacteria group bacterium]